MFYEHRVFRINCFKYGVVLSFNYSNSLLAMYVGSEMSSDMTSTTMFDLVPGSNHFVFQLTEEPSYSLQDYRKAFIKGLVVLSSIYATLLYAIDANAFWVYTNILSAVYSNIYNNHNRDSRTAHSLKTPTPSTSTNILQRSLPINQVC
jgi:hypothetical protein